MDILSIKRPVCIFNRADRLLYTFPLTHIFHPSLNYYFFKLELCRHRTGKMETVVSAAESSSSPPNWCFFGWLLGLTQLLLHGALGLVLFWVIYYLGGFGWQDQPKLEFNYHPVLMIGGFVYLCGNGKSFLFSSQSFPSRLKMSYVISPLCFFF